MELIGETIGPTEWRDVTQADINTFAELSGDHQWIHVDVDRAKSESPFGTTIAHGNLTLAMIDGFRLDLLKVEGVKLGVIGLAIGLPLSLGALRILIQEIGAEDAPIPIVEIAAAAAVIVVTVALAATWMPARKAAGVDPAMVLRRD